jgi:hypothetical protein
MPDAQTSKCALQVHDHSATASGRTCSRVPWPEVPLWCVKNSFMMQCRVQMNMSSEYSCCTEISVMVVLSVPDLGTGRFSSGSLPWLLSIFAAKGIEFDEIWGQSSILLSSLHVVACRAYCFDGF